MKRESCTATPGSSLYWFLSRARTLTLVTALRTAPSSFCLLPPCPPPALVPSAILEPAFELNVKVSVVAVNYIDDDLTSLPSSIDNWSSVILWRSPVAKAIANGVEIKGIPHSYGASSDCQFRL